MSESTTCQTINALICPVGEEPRLERICHSLNAFQQIVGGLIEPVSPYGGDWVAFAHEEGKITGEPRNMFAEIICKVNGLEIFPDWLAGTVFFVGSTPLGESVDVPERFAQYAREAWIAGVMG